VRSHAKASPAGSTERAKGHGRRTSPSFGGLLLVLSLLCLGLLFAPAPALALSHPFLETFASAEQPSFGKPEGMAVDQSSGDLLVIDGEANTVSRFNPDGTPAEFSALGTNVIDGSGTGDETPQSGLSFGGHGEVQIAVDNSGGATDGNIYVPQAGAKVVDVFASSGEYLGQLTESSEGALHEPCGVAVDPSGNLYVGDFSGAIHKYEPAANPPVNGDSSASFAFSSNCTLAAGAGATEGFLFATHYGAGTVAKLDSASGEEKYEFTAGPESSVSVDPASGHVYATKGEEIVEFDASGASSATEVSATLLASAVFGVALNGSSGNLYATREGNANVEVFGPVAPPSGHHFLETFGSTEQPSFSQPLGMAVNQSSGDLLVVDGEANTVSRWNPDGTPAEFSALGTNVIDGSGTGDETPQSGLSFGGAGEVQIAVDNSGGATDGNIYVPQAEAKVVDVFGEDGSYLGQLSESSEGALHEPCGVAVDPSGNLYVGDFSGAIHKYEPAANPPVNGDSSANFAFASNCTLVAGAGATAGFIFPVRFHGKVSKLDSTTGEEKYEVDSGENETATVDPATGHVYTAVHGGSEIKELDASGASGATEVSSTPLASAAFGVAVNGSTGNFYATREGNASVEVFAPGPSTTPEFELKIHKTGAGSGTVTSLAPNTGISCGSECSAEFEEGTEVELEATAEGSSEFTGWLAAAGNPGTCIGTRSPCKVTMVEFAELEANFAHVEPPAVTALSPSEGPTAGGNQVEVTGTDLAKATKVEFGTTVVNAPFPQNTATKIKVKAPAHAAGTADLVVTTAGGASADTAADDYTYVATPAVTALSPNKGPIGGGNQVEITGLRLAGATKVAFGTAEVACPSVDCALESATKIKVDAPAHAAGTVNIRVTTLGGTSGNFPQDDYTYEVPVPAVTPSAAGSVTASLQNPPLPPPLAEEKPKPLKCKRGLKKVKRHGKTVCVKRHAHKRGKGPGK
jgi:hypothetical protein